MNDDDDDLTPLRELSRGGAGCDRSTVDWPPNAATSASSDDSPRVAAVMHWTTRGGRRRARECLSCAVSRMAVAGTPPSVLEELTTG